MSCFLFLPIGGQQKFIIMCGEKSLTPWKISVKPLHLAGWEWSSWCTFFQIMPKEQHFVQAFSESIFWKHFVQAYSESILCKHFVRAARPEPRLCGHPSVGWSTARAVCMSWTQQSLCKGEKGLGAGRVLRIKACLGELFTRCLL